MSGPSLLILGIVLGAVLGALSVGGAMWLRQPGQQLAAPGPGPSPAPLGDALARVEDQLRRMELDRAHATGGLERQLRLLQDGQELLRGETVRLDRALRDPSSRGRWGELQLRRVVEMAGMLAQCDFVEQPLLHGADGPLRPDLVVRLPGGRTLAVDAKVPLRGWLEALEADDEVTRRERLADHGRQLRSHVGALSAKEYWAALPGSPEMVVAFLPADALLSAALEVDPSLLEFAVARRVMLATPVTLIAMLRSVAFGWQEEALVHNAREVADLGRELHRRLSVLSGHLSGLGRSLDRAVGSFNETVGSLESRVLVSARRLAQLGGTESDLAGPAPLVTVTRALRPTDGAAGKEYLRVLDEPDAQGWPVPVDRSGGEDR